MEPPLLRVQEAAALLRVSKWTIYRWIEEGRLRATKIGQGSLRIFRMSVNGLIEGARTNVRDLSDVSHGHGAPIFCCIDVHRLAGVGGQSLSRRLQYRLLGECIGNHAIVGQVLEEAGVPPCLTPIEGPASSL